MQRRLARHFALLLIVTFLSFFLNDAAISQSTEKIELWSGLAPGETVREPEIKDDGAPNEPAIKVTTPYLLLLRPEKQSSDACVLIIPGGGFGVCFYKNEGLPQAKYWNDRGYTAAILVYRVPRPTQGAIYARAFQDAQRAVRVLRANAPKYGFNPDKIGVEGYSAGGCLALLVAVNSEIQTYEPLDDVDNLSCSVAFAIPVYPAYVLDDGKSAPNTNGGESARILPDFHFDGKTPPMCLIHGDSDIYSSLGSLEVYKKLHRLGIPCELHIFAGAPHGYMFWDALPNACSWQDRRFAWIKKMGF